MRYEVNCVEHGEFFHFILEMDEKNPERVMEQAREDASLWGAEVRFIKPIEEEV